MQFPNLHSTTYSVETKDTKIMKDNLNDALNLATDMQQNGKDVEVYKDEPPIDTILGVEIFPVIHVKTKEEIYVSLEDIK